MKKEPAKPVQLGNKNDATQIIVPRALQKPQQQPVKQAMPEIDATVLLNVNEAPKPPPKQLKTDIENLLNSDESDDEPILGSPAFGQRQYSQKGHLLKHPQNIGDSVGDIIDELDANKKKPQQPAPAQLKVIKEEQPKSGKSTGGVKV